MTTLKTISMYLRAAKTEAEEAGVGTDGMADSVSKLREEILALTGNQVDIQLDEDTFKSTYQIMKEISGVWDQLTDISQANILEMLGGKRNANVVAALLTNFGTAESVMKYTANAEGSALAENAKYLDSIEGSIQKFDVALEEFSMNFIGADTVKNVVDLGTGLLHVLNTITEISEISGGLKGTLSAIGSTALSLGGSLLAGKVISKISESAKTGILSSVVQPFAVGSYYYGKERDSGKKAGESLKAATKHTATALTTAQKAAGAFIGFSTAISLVSTAVSIYKQRQEDAYNATIDGMNAYEDSKIALESYGDRISKLREQLDSGELSSSEAYDVRSELLGIEQELIDAYGLQAGQIDLINGKLSEQLGLVTAIGDEERHNWVQDNADIVRDAEEAMSSQTNRAIGVKIGGKNYNVSNDLNYKKYISEASNSVFGKDLISQDGAIRVPLELTTEEAYTMYGDFIDELEKEQKNYDEGTDAYEYIQKYIDALVDGKKTLGEGISEYEQIFETAQEDKLETDDDYSTLWERYNAEKSAADEARKSGESATDEYQKARNSLQDLLNQAKEDGDESLAAYLKNAINDLDNEHLSFKLEGEIDFQDAQDKYVQGMKEASDYFKNEDGTQIDWEKVTEAGNEFIDKGGRNLSEAAEQYKKLNDAAEEYGVTVEELVDFINNKGDLSDTFASVSDIQNEFSELLSGGLKTDQAKADMESLLNMIYSMDSESFDKLNIGEMLGLDGTVDFSDFESIKTYLEEIGTLGENSAQKLEVLSTILSLLGATEDEIDDILLKFEADQPSAEQAGNDGATTAQKAADEDPVETTTTTTPNPEPAKEAGEADGKAYADGFNAGASIDGTIDPERDKYKIPGASIDGTIDPDRGKNLRDMAEKDADEYRDAYGRRLKTNQLPNDIFGDPNDAFNEGKNFGELFAKGAGEPKIERDEDDYSDTDAAFKGGQRDREAYTKGYVSHTGKKPGQEGGIADSPVISPESNMTEFEAGVRQSVKELEENPVTLKVQTQVDEASKMTTMEEIRHKNAGSVTANTGNETTNKVVNITINPADAVTKLQAIADSMSEIPNSKKSSLKISCPGKAALQTVYDQWRNINSKVVTLTINTETNALGTYHRLLNSIPKSGKTGMTKGEFGARLGSAQVQSAYGSGDAKAYGTYRGTANAIGNNQVQKSTISLVGELGQEMLVRPSTGEWHTIGDRGPEFIPIQKGDIIFNARQTRELLTTGQLKSKGGSYGTAFANGTATTLSPSSGSKVHGSINVNITASADGEISDKLKEELDKIQKNIDEIIGNFEHEISIGEFKNASADQMIAIYKKMQDAVHQKANEYRAKGLSENSDYIQALTKQWWEYNQAIQDLTIEQFEDTRKNYENAIELTQNWMNVAVEESDYSSIVKYSNDIISYYKSMQDEVHKQAEYYRSLGYSETSDEVSELSSLWYEYGEKMNEAIQEAYDNMIENTSKAVDEITGLYESLQEAASQFGEYKHIDIDTFQEITELGVEYLSLLEDENGQLVINEDNINKIIAAKTEQLGVETALNYISQLRIALTEKDADEISRLLDVTNDASKSTWDLVYAQLALLGLSDEQYAAAKNNIDNIYSLTTATIGSIGSIGESTEEALDTILDYVMELVQHEVEDKIEGLEDQIDKYNEIIDKQKESLRLTKEQQEYEDEVSDKLEEINKIQNEIDLLSLDDSLEGKARRQELEEKLAELQKDLAEKQDDHAYDTINESLDKMAEDNEERISKEIEELNESISSTQKVYDLAVEKIKNTTWDTLYDELINWNYEYGNSLTQELVSAWNQATEAAKEYGGYLEYLEATRKLNTSKNVDKDSGKNSNIVANKKVFDDSKTKNQTVNKEQEAKDWLERMKANSKAWIVADDAGNEAETKRLDAENLDLGKKLGDYLGADLQRGTSEDGEHANGVWYIGDPSGGKRLYDYEFDSKKRASNFNTANNLLDEMIANAKAWKSIDDPNSQKLAARNEEISKQISSLTGYDITKHEGAWYVGSYKNGVRLFDTKTGYKLDLLKLNNANYVYHTGGVAGDKSTVKQNEVMALLEKGELIIDKKREEGLYKAVDFIEVLSNKLGKSIEISKLGSLIQGSSISASLTSVPDVGNIVNNNMNFNPHVEVNISHSGSLSDKDANRFGKITANSVIGELNEAFQRRGINNIGNAILR